MPHHLVIYNKLYESYASHCGAPSTLPSALTAGTSALDGTAPPGEAPSTAEQQQQQAQGREQKNQSRKVYEVHPGSYAGEKTSETIILQRCILQMPCVAYTVALYIIVMRKTSKSFTN